MIRLRGIGEEIQPLRKAVVLFVFMMVLSCFIINPSAATLRAQHASHNDQAVATTIRVELLSPNHIEGVTGQFVSVKARVENLGINSTGGVAYISIVDINSSQPIDLEDWSAQKGIYVPSIQTGQSLQLEWSVRLVKAGSYTITVIFDNEGDLSPPISSPRISLQVLPKINLNPNNVLPVAFGMPIGLILAFALINYGRGKKTGVYQ
jgi:hypothetical protein